MNIIMITNEMGYDEDEDYEKAVDCNYYMLMKTLPLLYPGCGRRRRRRSHGSRGKVGRESQRLSEEEEPRLVGFLPPGILVRRSAGVGRRSRLVGEDGQG